MFDFAIAKKLLILTTIIFIEAQKNELNETELFEKRRRNKRNLR